MMLFHPVIACMGAWISYALGSVSEELPAFVVLPDPGGLPYNQKGNFSAGFLPAQYQGTLLDVQRAEVVPYLQAVPEHSFATGSSDRATRQLLRELNRKHADSHLEDSHLESQIAAGELAGKLAVGFGGPALVVECVGNAFGPAQFVGRRFHVTTALGIPFFQHLGRQGMSSACETRLPTAAPGHGLRSSRSFAGLCLAWPPCPRTCYRPHA